MILPIIICLISGWLYAFFFNRLGVVWTRKTNSLPTENTKEPEISIIIAFRNERSQLNRLIESLENQHYPCEKVEIIWVDDHSTDGSSEVIKTLIEKSKFHHTLLLNSGIGKKEALKSGRLAAKHEWLLFTDADVWVQPYWIKSMVSGLKEDTLMICGPVQFSGNSGFWNYWMTVEFAGVMASGAGLMESGKPLMANGANLIVHCGIYEKFKLHGLAKSSGDDVFLLQALAHNPERACFCFDARAIVYTHAPKGMKEFLQQRWRWASKSTTYQPFYARIIPLLLAIYHLLILSWIPWGGILFVIKWITDAWFFRRILSFFGIPKPGLRLLLMECIHTLYMVFISVTALWIPNVWKGRKVN